MALIVKIMSDEDLADDDFRKSFELFTDVKNVEFHRRPGAPVAALTFNAGSALDGEYPLVGNVYVMNESGKTVAHFGVAPPMTADRSQDTGYQHCEGEEFLRNLPYDLAAAIRRSAVASGDAIVVGALDRQQVAVDAR